MTPTAAWTPFPPRPTLPDGVVDVVRVELDAVPDGVSASLAADERARADRFVRPVDRRRWIAARGALRHILGSFLGVDPATVVVAAGPHGKPRLAGEASLRFSFSHAEGFALCALATDVEVGVDVEDASRTIDVVGVAERVFGGSEATRLARLGERERRAAFLRLWTRHEAAVKCAGTGLGASAPPPQVWIADLDVDGMPAAVACEREPREVRCWIWKGDAAG